MMSNTLLAEIDILGLIGVNLAIIAVASGFAVLWVELKFKRLKEGLDEQDRLKVTSKYYIAGLSNIAVEMQGMLEVHTAVIHQLVSVSSSSKDMPNLSAENKRLRDRLERVMQELMLVSSDEIARRSAIQQLSQILGNRQSLTKMREAEGFYPMDMSIKRGIQDLSGRILEN